MNLFCLFFVPFRSLTRPLSCSKIVPLWCVNNRYKIPVVLLCSSFHLGTITHHWSLCDPKVLCLFLGKGSGETERILEKKNKSRRGPADVKTARHTACCHWIWWTAKEVPSLNPLPAQHILTKRLILALICNAPNRPSWQQLFEWQGNVFTTSRETSHEASSYRTTICLFTVTHTHTHTRWQGLAAN